MILALLNNSMILGDVESLGAYSPSESDGDSPKCNTAGCSEDTASGSEAWLHHLGREAGD